MYDIIGDIHGCYEEWMILIKKLGYIIEKKGSLQHPEGRRMILAGDLTDRGPESVKVIQQACNWFEAGCLLYVPGNHCNKLYRYLLGRPVQIKHGLETTVDELMALSQKERTSLCERFLRLYEKAPLYLILDKKRLVVAHAGIPEKAIGDYSAKVKSFVFYGDTTGKNDEHGRPVRRDWARHYHGPSWIVYGHTPVKEPRIINQTVNIDTGCVFGGALTAFRYPELLTVSTPSLQPFCADRFRDFEE